MAVVDVAALHVAGRAEHLRGDTRHVAPRELAHAQHVEPGLERCLWRHAQPPILVVRVRIGASRPSPRARAPPRRRRSRPRDRGACPRSPPSAPMRRCGTPRGRTSPSSSGTSHPCGPSQRRRRPAPQFTAKYRPSARPRCSLNDSSSSAFPISTPVASTGSVGSPSARTRMFVAPPGSTPSAVSVPASEFTTSLIVPSPEKTTTRSTPSSTAWVAISLAWPRSFVSVTSRRKSADIAFSITASVGWDTVRATGLTMRRTRWNRIRAASIAGCARERVGR